MISGLLLLPSQASPQTMPELPKDWIISYELLVLAEEVIVVDLRTSPGRVCSCAPCLGQHASDSGNRQIIFVKVHFRCTPHPMDNLLSEYFQGVFGGHFLFVCVCKRERAYWATIWGSFWKYVGRISKEKLSTNPKTSWKNYLRFNIALDGLFDE